MRLRWTYQFNHPITWAAVIVGVLAALVALLLEGCIDSRGPRIASQGVLQVRIAVPESAGAGLQAAAEDLATALGRMAGAPGPAAVVHAVEPTKGDESLIAVQLDPDAGTGAQGYRIRRRLAPARGLLIRAESEQGAMYGLYALAAELGVCYLHPEQTYYPDAPYARLPWHYADQVQRPDFALRGFHEHTQHPIPLSDFWLRPGREDFRDYLSHYLRWLARNRQNAASFMLLKSVDLEAWLPYAADAIAEAHDYFIQVGFAVSFVDQQQNAYKLLAEPEARPGDDQRIRAGLDRLLAAGPDFVVFQIGSSEFTKPADADLLGWLDTATAHLSARRVRPYAWIHIICSLLDEQGGLFYHLPLQAPAALGAWVHTTMFYTLSHPAPVYDCEDFGHQLGFMAAADGQREQVFFPETAWWLGFDNNLPLLLPITGWSRQHDIQRVLDEHQVSGHVTFTSGREWTYWQYDHYLTRATWDAAFSWQEYLEWIRPLYGPRGGSAVSVLAAWTDLQRAHFYEQEPLIYFYLAGELPQDEIGAVAGILARRPKLAFRDLVRFDDARFAEWQAGDLAMLERMRGEYARLLEKVNPEPGGERQIERQLYRELYTGLWVYVQRIDHALALYRGAAAARTWFQQQQREQPDESLRAAAEQQAEAQLAAARAISQAVGERLQAMEADYRYPAELLCGDKPHSPTVYPYGYLSQTSSAYFWTRRDEQLAALIQRTFHADEQRWEGQPEAVFAAGGEHIEMLVPDSEMAAEAIAGFIPRLLFGLRGPQEGALTLLLAQDADENDRPDPATEQPLALAEQEGRWRGALPVYSFVVYDAAGREMGLLDVVEPDFSLDVELDGGALAGLDAATIEGRVSGPALVDMVVTMGGIDAEGAAALIKAVYGVGGDEPLPALLPFAFRMTFERL